MKAVAKSWCVLLLVLGVMAASGGLSVAAGPEASRRVRLETSLGNIVIALDAQAAPETVGNFLQYVTEGFYDGTIFHRVVPDFVVQGGGLTPDMVTKPTRGPVRNEAGNGLQNRRGTVAMARTADPHSATAQFFINLRDNPFLNFRSESAQEWGYCVFGEVVEGMAVVETLARVTTVRRAGFADVPDNPVVIQRAVLQE
jgi:peptidyl-prolyl cis-trans isomerase B (cyclophilin B)